MGDFPKDVKDQVAKLIYDAPGFLDDTLKGSGGDACKQTLVRICVTPAAGSRKNWKEAAPDFDPPTEDMVQQIKWTWEDIQKHPRVGKLLKVEFVANQGDADITYFSGTPNPNGKSWAGLTGGYTNKDGKVCKEVLINPRPTVSTTTGERFEAWVHKELCNKPEHYYNPQNRHGQAARIVKHETAHALGINHWGYTGVQDQREIGNSKEVDTDITIAAYRVGKNPKHDYRDLDWLAMEQLYDPAQRQLPPPKVEKAWWDIFSSNTGWQR